MNKGDKISAVIKANCGLNDLFEFPLKSQQAKAFATLIEFLINKDKKIFILKGYAGTGKTTLMSGLIKWLQKEKTPFALLASTGRAAKILSDKTKTKANTVHSHIYVFNALSEDLEAMSSLQQDMAVDDKGQINLLFGLRTINSNTEKIYIIDEASMISDELEKSTSFAKFGTGDLLNDILTYDPNGKFIFIGDPCQLPPVHQQNSPALSASYISSKYRLSTEEVELTEIVRQADTSGIVEASLKIRNLYKSNPITKWATLPVKNHKNIILQSSHAQLLDHYISKIQTDGFEHATMICQTNKHCSDLNAIVRRTFHQTNDRLVRGDLLMITQNNYLSPLVNGDQVTITKIGTREYRAGLSFLQVEVEPIATKTSFSLLLIEDILYSNYTNLNNKQHKNLMIDFYERMKLNKVYQKDQQFKDNMMKDPYLNALKAVYGYALTCHKSQGGEWNEVFLYLDNKIHGLKKPGIYQWWYTAVTRAKENLYLVNDWFIK